MGNMAGKPQKAVYIQNIWKEKTQLFLMENVVGKPNQAVKLTLWTLRSDNGDVHENVAEK